MPEVIKRVPPSSVEAEQSILGSMMLSENCALAAVEKLKEEDFFVSSHRRIFRAACDLSALGRPIDLVTLTERMEVASKLSIEELTYLSELTQRVPSTRNIDSYIEIVRQKSMLRRLIDACGDISDLAFKGEGEAAEIVGYAGDVIYRLSNDNVDRSLRHIRQALLESYQLISEAAKSKTGLMGIPTGFPLMDKMLSGVQPGQLIVVAGRPGMGKTSFAMNIVEHVGAKEHHTVAVFSLEMSGAQIALRMLCAGAQVDSQKVRTGALGDDDYFKLADAMEPLGDSGIYLDDSASIGTTEMLAKLRRLRQQTGELGLVVIDYLQLMSTGQRTDNRQQEISQLTRTLKIMAKELNCPIVLLSQLSRASEKRESKRPMLSDLRESGAIEQDADVVIFLHRDDYYNDEENAAPTGIAKIIIAKQRNGPTGTIQVAWKGEQTRYVELDYVHEDE